MVGMCRDDSQESQLARMTRLTEEHDYGAITAFRYARDCDNGEKYTERENKARNLSLLAKIRVRVYGIGVATVKGALIEGYGASDEKYLRADLLLVFDIQDKGNLRDVLVQLGEEFDQDCILFGSAGEHPVLIGTGKCPGSWPGYGKVVPLGRGIFDKDGKINLRRNCHPFVFDQVESGISIKRFPSEMIGPSICAKMHWNELMDDED